MSNRILIPFAIAFLLALSCIYTVSEGQQAILLRLGKIVQNEQGLPKTFKPGLHVKLPFVHTARVFDTRIQTLDIKTSRIVTAEKKDVLVDYFAKWRIENLPLYFIRTGGNAFQAQSLLEQTFNDGLRAQFGKRTIADVVSGERTDIMAILRDNANKSSKDLGIAVVDVRIKRIDLPNEVSTAVYDRMRAERERVATEPRAEGKSASEALRANADAKVTVLLATANSDAKRIRGDGDGQAAKIYATAYKKDEKFYSLYRSLQAYKESFNKAQDILVLNPNTEFFKFFNQSNGKAKP